MMKHLSQNECLNINGGALVCENGMTFMKSLEQAMKEENVTFKIGTIAENILNNMFYCSQEEFQYATNILMQYKKWSSTKSCNPLTTN